MGPRGKRPGGEVTPPRPPKRSIRATVLDHNVGPKADPQRIAELILARRPTIATLHEANRIRAGVLNRLDEAADAQRAPRYRAAWPAAPHEGRGNPTLTRALLLTSWVMVMSERWVHKKDKNPRRYTVAKIRLGSVLEAWAVLHVVSVHFPSTRNPRGNPNAAAWKESARRLVELAADITTPLIIVGDFNGDRARVAREIAELIGGRVVTTGGVDHAVVRDGKDAGVSHATAEAIGKHGSDHEARWYELTVTKL